MKFQKSPTPFIAILLFMLVYIPVMDYQNYQDGRIEIQIKTEKRNSLDKLPYELVLESQSPIASLEK